MPDSGPRRATPRPRLVLFDLDDTLCDHDTSLRLRLRRAFAAAGHDLPAPEMDALIEAAMPTAFSYPERFADLLATHGVTDPALQQRGVDAYLSDRYHGLELFEEALSVVEAIKRQARVGMITNGPTEIQRNKIIRLEIAELFPFVLISEEVGVWKPDPAIFQRALELGEAAPEEAVYVGDSPEHDIAGARAAGITSVWINRTGRAWAGGPPPDYEIGNLRELFPLFGFDPPSE